MADVNELIAAARQRQHQGAWQEAAALWRECLWRFPGHEDRAAHSAAYGRALLEAGDTARALAVLERAVRLYPDHISCRSTLALAYSRCGAFDRAAPLWADVLSKAEGHRDRRWWLVSAAHSFLELTQIDKAEEACRQAIADYPEAPGGYGMLSVVCERRFQWEKALELVTRALSLCTESERPALVASKLRILTEMGAVVAAEATLEEELARAPESGALLAAGAHLAAAQGMATDALRRWNACMSAAPESPAGYLGKAAFLQGRGRAKEAEALLQQAGERWPNLASVHQALAETLAQRRDLEGARSRWQEAERLSPLSVFCLWAHCAFLGSCGAREEAESLLASRGAQGSVLWRGRYEYAKAARELDAALACLAELRSAAPAEAVLAYAEAEIRSWRQADGDLELAAEGLRAMLLASPAAVRAGELLVRVLVLLGRPDEAAGVLASLPEEDGRRGLSEERAWDDVRRGDWASARKRWQQHTARFFLPALHLPAADLRPVGGKIAEAEAGGVLAATMVRNELPRLPDFLAHHRRLGVSGFIVIDNGSSDGTVDFLREQPDVVLYATEEGYAQSHFGIRWLNQVIERHARGWVLYADADERLVFPGSERRPLQHLVSFMAARGDQVLPGVMIDMFPREAAGGDDAKHEWFDPLRIRPSVTCPFIEAAGGARRRLFGTTVTLSKAPLINAGAGVRYLSSHATTPAPVSAIRAGLLHYHLDYLFDASNVARIREEVARGEHSDFAVDRRRSLTMTQALTGAGLTGAESARYEDTAQLVRLGLLATTEAFEALG